MDDRLIVVTGSSGGIGQGIVKLLVEEGPDVASIDWHDGSEPTHWSAKIHALPS
jgi:NAD(P)-dependent dehydrogenase (short-subunit alcohol dehydrogenase family)